MLWFILGPDTRTAFSRLAVSGALYSLVSTSQTADFRLITSCRRYY